MHQFYTASAGSVTTAASVPVLWDRRSRRVVSNDSGDIAAMFNSEFDEFSTCVHRRPLTRASCSCGEVIAKLLRTCHVQTIWSQARV